MSLVVGFLFLIVRLVVATMVAPILGHRAVPAWVRVTLGFLVALIVAPTVLPEFITSFSPEISPASIFSQCLSEATIGTAMGLCMLIIFSTAMMIGSSISQLSGLQLESVFGNDQGFGQHPTSQLIGLAAACVFVLSGGLELALSSMLDSFTALPIGNSLSGENAVNLVTSILHQSFELTIRAIAPAIAALLVSTLVIGMVARSLPQLNLVQIGLSTNTGLMLTAAFLTLGGCVWLVMDDFEKVNDLIVQTLPSLGSSGGPNG
jgi:flagellar biosynthetic protein FliR